MTFAAFSTTVLLILLAMAVSAASAWLLTKEEGE